MKGIDQSLHDPLLTQTRHRFHYRQHQWCQHQTKGALAKHTYLTNQSAGQKVCLTSRIVIGCLDCTIRSKSIRTNSSFYDPIVEVLLQASCQLISVLTAALISKGREVTVETIWWSDGWAGNWSGSYLHEDFESVEWGGEGSRNGSSTSTGDQVSPPHSSHAFLCGELIWNHEVLTHIKDLQRHQKENLNTEM